MKLNDTTVAAAAAALRRYQGGDSLSDEEIVRARDFAAMLVEIGFEVPDVRILRFYNQYVCSLDSAIRARGLE